MKAYLILFGTVTLLLAKYLYIFITFYQSPPLCCIYFPTFQKWQLFTSLESLFKTFLVGPKMEWQQPSFKLRLRLTRSQETMQHVFFIQYHVQVFYKKQTRTRVKVKDIKPFKTLKTLILNTF